MRRAIMVKEDVYKRLAELKKELSIETFNGVIEKLIMTYESLKKYQELAQLLQDLEGFYNVWSRVRQLMQKIFTS